MNSKRLRGFQTLVDQLLALPQHLIPHHIASRAMGRLTRIRQPAFKNLVIEQFVKHYRVDLSAAVEQNARAYPDFNSFFTRALRPETRPVSNEGHDIAAPVDGTTSALGEIGGSRIFQAKGHYFTLDALLGGSPTLARRFDNGRFITLYLSPRDYHRIHMPVTGRLLHMRYIPGRLFSVNANTTRAIDGLFARNERVVAVFSTAAGMMALVIVGAIFVGGIETVWHGVVAPSRDRSIRQWDYDGVEDEPVNLQHGEEMGRFNMGSTVIVLFAGDRAAWDSEIRAGRAVIMGQTVGCWRTGED
jgi:phosphatidylserine decarboxylase